MELKDPVSTTIVRPPLWTPEGYVSTGEADLPAQPALLAARFDTQFANAVAALEAYKKHLYRPNTYLHKWWARRCGSTFRLILKHLVADERHQDYYSPGGLEGKVILDPMMGGGTTLHEAIRLGANVIGADIDPIPVLQARASLSDLPLETLETAFASFLQRLQTSLAPLFATACPHCGEATEAQFTLYGLQQSCACGPVLVMDSTVLRQEADGTVVRICPACWKIGTGGHSCLTLPLDGQMPLVTKGTRHCSRCQGAYEEDLTTPYYARYVPVVVVGQCRQHGLFFRTLDSADAAQLREADLQRATLDLDPAAFAIEPGPKSADLVRKGAHSYLDLFSSRQLFYLQQAIDELRHHEPLPRLNLALLVSTSLEFNSMLCGYKGGDRRRPGAIRHTFSHHAYSFPYTALENNPIYPRRASGNLRNLFEDRIRRARIWAQQPLERKIEDDRAQVVPIEGERDAGTEVHNPVELNAGSHRFLLIQGSSARLPLPPASVDYIVTDPPYFDSVQYTDLAAFFRVWLRQLVPAEGRWEYDAGKSAVDPQRSGNGQYVTVLGGIFTKCRRVLRDEGLLVFTFHHWSPKGWTALTLALQRAGFHLVNRYVVHSENPVSVHIANLKALTDDAVLVLSPRATDVGAWKLPSSIDRSDSAAFCRDCATALGYLLSARLSETQIAEQWAAVLG